MWGWFNLSECQSTKIRYLCYRETLYFPKWHKGSFFISIRVQLIYNVVLILGVQQSGSVIHIYNIYIHIQYSDSFPI